MLTKNVNFQIPANIVTDAAKTYANPAIEHFADPCIAYCQETGFYYASRPCFEPFGITVSRSRTLAAPFKDELRVFTVGEEVGLYHDVWASELHRIGDRWYIYAAASCSPTEDWPERKRRTFVLESRTADPFDGFDFAGVLEEADAAIDATVFQCKKNSKMYLVYSRCIDVDRQSLFICEMETPTKLKGEHVRIARATYPWELVAPYDGIQRINEGPFFIQENDRTFCVFCANGCWVDEYCLGIMELVGDDPMNLSAWVKDDVPLFSYANGVYAPGHASFFHSPDGKELFVAYHAVREHNPNDQPMPRHMCAQRVYFDETGFPHIGQPIPFGERITLPSGDPGKE